MANLTYQEPGVYVDIVNNQPSTGFAPPLVPYIIGEGPAYFDFTGIQMTRGNTGLNDTLPSTIVTAIISVYTMVGTVQTIITATNYTLTAPNVLTWGVSAPNAPAPGATYYVTYEARPELIQYQTTFITSFSSLATAYGGMFMNRTSLGTQNALNPVYLGAYLALEAGASGVYVQQIQPGNMSTYALTMATDMPNALVQAQTVSGAYYMVPMTNATNDPGLVATNAVITHCNYMSTENEREERVCFLNYQMESLVIPTTGVISSANITTAVNAISEVNNRRVTIPFITTVTDVLSDGALHTLTCEYVCASLAGLASSLPVQRALTRQKLYNFVMFNNMSTITRDNLNTLAAAGFLVFTQPGGSGSAGVVRHGITTSLDGNLEDTEFSVVAIVDYVSKYLRSCLDGYIGLFNIDNFLLSKVKATINNAKISLIKNNVLVDLTLNSVAQDTAESDALLVSINILPPYPCNYINVTLLVD